MNVGDAVRKNDNKPQHSHQNQQSQQQSQQLSQGYSQQGYIAPQQGMISHTISS